MDSQIGGAHAPTDRQLLLEAAGGAAHAFAELLDRYVDPLLNYADRITGVLDDAPGLVQDALTETVIEARGQGESATEPARQLYGKVRAVAELRRRRRAEPPK